ncbi:MAG TPA: 30S ribosomal protein S20 [Bryobacterales bacterium]|nr:30S ribosomal protein S20 [Bryobacterales bacterium]
MANHYSALKRARQTKRRTTVNRQNVTRLRHQIRALRRALQSGDKSGVQPVFAETISLIDRAARKGVIKKNTAARYKSRLSLRVNALQAAPAA